MLGLNNLPTFNSPEPGSLKGLDTASAATPGLAMNTPVSSADSQALQQVSDPAKSQADQALLAKMDNVQIQVGTAQAQLSAAPPPPSTLSVLSMMDATLRAEDIESLKNEFDALQAAPATDSLNLPPGAGFNASEQRNTAHAATPAAQVFANNPDMAQTYENLSQKLTTELAARMHEKLNAGEWKMKFALKPASLGLVDVQLETCGMVWTGTFVTINHSTWTWRKNPMTSNASLTQIDHSSLSHLIRVIVNHLSCLITTLLPAHTLFLTNPRS
jgi:hypothetical protein